MGLRSLGAALLFLFAAVLPVRAETVDLRLVLASDVSRSIDDSEFQLQRKGYAAAFADPRVLRAIRSGERGRIAICYVEWAGENSQKVVIDWTVIADEEGAGAFAQQLLDAPRSFADRTSIGIAIQFAMAQFARSGHESQRRTIDVSGDGTNTNGLHPSIARDAAVTAGVTINGLVILEPNPQSWNAWHTNPPGGLDEYYRQNVIGGPSAFVMVAEDFASFAYAITNKLIREIADASAPVLITAKQR
jgi:hypothetical protein